MNNIVSQKIKNARALRGLSQQQLADMIGVSKQMISKYEKGDSLPTSSNLIKIGKALKLKIDYFFQPKKIELGSLNFRKKSTCSKKKQDALEQSIIIHLENYLEIEVLLNIDYSFKNPIANEKIKSMEDIESAVLILKNEWQIGLDPIHNIIQLLEDNEIKVIELLDVENEFDGLATYVNNKFPVIVVNGNFSVERKRFTLLHELGHLLLNLPDCDNKNEEKFCNKFASEFLFPRKSVIKEFGIKRNSVFLEEFVEVQKKYGISIPAIVYSLVHAGVFSENRQIQFYKKINSNPALKKDVNKERFATPEKSNRLEQLIFRALSQEIISVSKAATLLNKNISMLKEKYVL